MNKNKVKRWLVFINEAITLQLQQILHHPRFQRLESTWLGIDFLVQYHSQLKSTAIKIKLLNLSWMELSKDLQHAIEFDQSLFFARIYNDEFGHPGGEAFGLIIGDYYLTHSVSSSIFSDVATLKVISDVAACAFVPFITSISPSFLGLDHFYELGQIFSLEDFFLRPEYEEYRKLQDQSHARFIGLVLPQFLIRAPYSKKNIGDTVYRSY
jgi:type VI secretion system protein ImpD